MVEGRTLSTERETAIFTLVYASIQAYTVCGEKHVSEILIPQESIVFILLL